MINYQNNTRSFGNNYSYGPGVNAQGYSFGWTRLWIKISSWFGIIMMMILVIGWFYLYGKGVGKTSNQFNNDIVVYSYNSLIGLQGWLLIFLIWAAVKSFVCSFGLLRYAKLPDNEFVANKYQMAVLSLTIGGFFTPFILIRLPNVDVKTTQNARVTIVKYFGTSGAVAGILTAFALLAVKSTIPGGNQIWVRNQESIYWGMFGGFLALGILTGGITFPFYGDKAQKVLASRGKNYHYYNVVSIIFTVIATIELCILVVVAILRVFAEFARAAQAENGIETFLFLMRAIFQAVYTVMLMYIVIQVIKGLWRTDKNGLMFMGKSQKFENYQTQQKNR